MCSAQCNILFFSQLLSPSGENPDHRMVAYKAEQPTAGCMAIFHKYRCYMNMEVL